MLQLKSEDIWLRFSFFLLADMLMLIREAFLLGIPPPDFPGGIGESMHVGRATEDLIMTVGGRDAMIAMGF